MPNLKQDFIKRILEEEGKRMINNQGIEMQRRLQFHTGRLFRDRTVTVTDSGENGAKLHFKFPIYLRFLDIKGDTKKKKRSGGLKPKEGYRIYNRFVQGHFRSIANRVAVDFTDDVANRITNTFNK